MRKAQKRLIFIIFCEKKRERKVFRLSKELIGEQKLSIAIFQSQMFLPSENRESLAPRSFSH